MVIAAVPLGGMSRSIGFGCFFESFTSFRSRCGKESWFGVIGRLFFALIEVVWDCAKGEGGGWSWGRPTARFSAMNVRICWSRSERREDSTGTGEVLVDK